MYLFNIILVVIVKILKLGANKCCAEREGVFLKYTTFRIIPLTDCSWQHLVKWTDFTKQPGVTQQQKHNN